ncbi:hypothetical protein DFH09DRAFT_1364574 [Mycena vulgaris]|nr:hypothetical protein DFH09DRAFT_1364574 [Mycena vulgaris]
MLFQGTACFSPAVPASLRSAWVKHGGSLTHSKDDFLRATAFFCDGPDDPWLKELLSRSLVGQSRGERRASPLTETKILVGSPFAVDIDIGVSTVRGSRVEIHPRRSIRRDQDSAGTTTPDALSCEELQTAPKPKTLKRSLDSENHDDSRTEIDPRPLKRARLQPDLSPRQPLSPTSASRTLVSIQLPAPPSPTPLVPTQAPSRPRTRRRTRTLISPSVRIDFTAFKPIPAVPVLSFPARPRARDRHVVRSDVTPQLENIASAPPRTSIAELLRAPRADACLFTVSETYREKVFACLRIPP